jgi:hypothetical protein
MWNYLAIINLLMWSPAPAEPKLLHHHPIPHAPTCTPPPPPKPYTHRKVISAVTCYPSYVGGAATEVVALEADGTTYYVSNSGTSTLQLLCDAQLPGEAVDFDYADLEAYAPNSNGADNPSMWVFVDTVSGGVGTLSYSNTDLIGSCGLNYTLGSHSGAYAIGVCRAAPNGIFPVGNGPFASVTQTGPWSYPSIHFVVLIPPAPPGGQAGHAYRIVAYYEAP